jgi:hypothetical protein
VSRGALLTVAAIGLVLFAVFSFLLARTLTGPGDERASVLEVLRAQADGDADAVLALLPACKAEPGCVTATRKRVAELERPGDVEILKYDPSMRFALGTSVGTGRVAWRTGTDLPVVQCVRVRRHGPADPVRVQILALSDAKDAEASC